MASPLAQLLASVKDGLVLISPTGVVKYSNEAATQRFGPSKIAELIASPELKKQVRFAQAAPSRLPTHFSLALDGDERTFACTLVQAPNQTDYGILLHDARANSAHSEALKSMIEIVDQEIGEPIRALLALDPRQVAPEATLPFQEIVNRLDKLKGLMEAFGESPLVGSDRIVLKDMVTRAWNAVAPLAASLKAEASLVGFHDDLATVYGSADWIHRAIRECLDNALRHSIAADAGGRGCHVEIRARSLGEMVSLTFRNMGIGAIPQVEDRILIPFSRAGGPRRLPGQGMGVGLPLARRILELHGGHLKIATEGDESVSIALELPTGAPFKGPAGQGLLQAQKYAQDLARLMARQRRSARAAAVTE